MKTALITICILLALGSICNAEVIFQSKWENPSKASWNVADDGGAWHYAYVAGGNITLERVTGDQSSLAGPSSPPPGSNASYFLRETWVPNGQDCQVYLQANFSTQTDLYMGMWFYFNRGFSFLDSMKFMDFRTNNQAVGNGHLALFGFDHNQFGCGSKGTGAWNNPNYCNSGEGGGPPCGVGTWSNYHNLTAFRYLYGAGQGGDEYHLNWYNSLLFDQNLKVDGTYATEVGYSCSTPSRICVTGGKWYAMIVHAKIHATDGELDAWIKPSDGEVKKVMQWNRNTVWDVAGGPHNFYTVNGSGAIDHIQINSYWNSWPSASGTRRVWIGNVVVATTFEEVKNYLGITDANAPKPPTGLRIAP